jgi:hypothetical protein
MKGEMETGKRNRRPYGLIVTGSEFADLGRDARLARPLFEERTSEPLVPTL